MAKWYFDRLDREFSRCWSILAKNNIFARKNAFLWLDYSLSYKYTELHIQYCIYSTVSSSLDVQTKFNMSVAPPLADSLLVYSACASGAWTFIFFKYILAQLFFYNTVYTLLYIQYSKKFSLDFQNKSKNSRAPARPIPVWNKIIALRGARIFNFFSYYIWYTRLYIQYCKKSFRRLSKQNHAAWPW